MSLTAFKIGNLYNIKRKDILKYYKYQFVGDESDLVTPYFSSKQEAMSGIDDVKIIQYPDFWNVMSNGIGSSYVNQTVIIDTGAYGIKSLTYQAMTYPGAYPSLLFTNFCCSEDGENWTLIASNVGWEYGAPVVQVTYPNYYRYVKITTATTDWGYAAAAGGYFRLTYVNRKRIAVESTAEDYDFTKTIIECKAFDIN